MNAPINSRTFKSGNSVALRLPKSLGVGPDENLVVDRHGDTITARIVPTPAEEAERMRRFQEMLQRLQEIGPVGEIEVRDPFEFPDRPGL